MFRTPATLPKKRIDQIGTGIGFGIGHTNLSSFFIKIFYPKSAIEIKTCLAHEVSKNQYPSLSI
jgi:hypothetical protein